MPGEMDGIDRATVGGTALPRSESLADVQAFRKLAFRATSSRAGSSRLITRKAVRSGRAGRRAAGLLNAHSPPQGRSTIARVRPSRQIEACSWTRYDFPKGARSSQCGLLVVDDDEATRAIGRAGSPRWAASPPAATTTVGEFAAGGRHHCQSVVVLDLQLSDAGTSNNFMRSRARALHRLARPVERVRPARAHHRR